MSQYGMISELTDLDWLQYRHEGIYISLFACFYDVKSYGATLDHVLDVG